MVKSAYGDGLAMSQVWCDVLNFLVGILIFVNGLRLKKYPHFQSKMVCFTGGAYCGVTLASLILFHCLGKKTGEENISLSFWNRVWMFPLLTTLFIMAILYSWPFVFTAQFYLALIGYSWFLI